MKRSLGLSISRAAASIPAIALFGVVLALALGPVWWLAGATGGLLFTAAACWSFSRRDVL